MIELSRFCKSYGSFPAVNDVSFTVQKGRIGGLLGANGAGKTTILKAIIGVHYASSGDVRVNGLSVNEYPLAAKAAIGYVSESPRFYEQFTVSEFLRFVADVRFQSRSRGAYTEQTEHGVQNARHGLSARRSYRSYTEQIEKAAERCALTDVFHKKIAHLSKGYRQRLAFACAIMHDPSVLVLDEPVSGLDPIQIQEMRALIRSLSPNRTILLSTHLMQEVDALCEDIFILHGGTLVASGTAAEITAKERAPTFEEAFLRLCSKRSQR